MFESKSYREHEGGGLCTVGEDSPPAEHFREPLGEWEGYDPDILIALDE